MTIRCTPDTHRPFVYLTLIASVVSLLLVRGATGAQASLPDHGEETLVSAPSALADSDLGVGGCAWDAGGVVRPLEVDLDYESTIAVDPLQPERLVTVWLADDGLTVNSATSIDGGRSWKHEALPGATTCTGGAHRTSYDVRVSVGTDLDGSSRAYAIFTSQNQPFPDPRAVVATISVSTNALDGSGWSDPVVVDASGSVDFPVVAASPTESGTAYAMWSKRFDATMFSVTRDGGRHWTSPQLLRVSTTGNLALNELTTSDSGTLVNAFVETPATVLTDPTVPSRMYVSQSEDSGTSWSEPELVASDVTSGFGVAARGNESYFTWVRPAADSEVVFRSTGPTGWSEVSRLDGGPTLELPSVSVMANGTLGILHYETDATANDGTRPANVVLSYSSNAGRTWTQVRPTHGFDRNQIPFVGDHSSVAATACGFVSTRTMGSDRSTYGRSDIFFSAFGISSHGRSRCRPGHS